MSQVIRFLDIVFSFVGIIVLAPFFIICGLSIMFTSKGGVFFVQERIGLKGKPFKMYKFRTMRPNSDRKGLLTIGSDIRITVIGEFLRKFKLDELPQLINVLSGSMSIVGPRPEVAKYVAYYNNEQKLILNVKPGITDLASIEFKDENEILGNVENPDEHYINVIMPKKIELNGKFINKPNVRNYFEIIFLTLGKIFM